MTVARADSADKRVPVLCIMGPTAAGKTDLAVEMVKRFPFSIISVDSALVYRGMDIGTAKPDARVQRVAPHRLVDILDPVESYSAARFCRDAVREIKDIQSDGRIPLLVGGTMLYFRALQRGLSELPSADPAVRRRLEKARSALGLSALYERLVRVDPVAAARIHPRDWQRIQRVLEISELTGRPITELYQRRSDKSSSFRFFNVVIAPPDRQLLHRRIEQRFLAMLEQGLVAEVEALRARGDLGLDKPSMRAVGYRQVWEYLDGLTDYAHMVQRAEAATRQFAKRQLTWLRSEPDALWLNGPATTVARQLSEGLRLSGFFPESC